MMRLVVFALLAAALVVLVVFVLPRTPAPEPAEKRAAPAATWNASAIESTFAGVRVKEVDATHAGLIFSYDLDNNTDTDYQMTKGPNTVVMTRLKSDGSLSSDEPVELNNSVFLPARNRTRISVEVTRNFNWPTGMGISQIGPVNQEKFRKLVTQEVANVSGFVLFDQTSHFQIELPGGWGELQAQATAAGAS
jgi:hypothetical protein